VIDEFASRFVYFYTGYIGASYIFSFADGVRLRSGFALAFLFAWGVLNSVFVSRGWAELPFVSLALGLLGASAVVTVSTLFSKADLFAPLRWCGRNSIVIYLAFFLPMAASRSVLLKTGMIGDVGTISLLVTLAGVAAPLIVYWLVRDTRLRFLFERPEIFKLRTKPRLALQPAE
jgi:uncharacterized membrane protein YcfT